MKNFLFLLLAIFVFSACNKDDDSTNAVTPANGPKLDIPLTVGSYWIYQEYYINPVTGDTAFQPGLDSVYMASDTLINGHTYAIKMDEEWGVYPGNIPVPVRDSAGYLVNPKGVKLYSNHDFTNVLHVEYPVSSMDSTFQVIYRMSDNDAQVTVPAGTFTTANYKGMVPPNNTITEPGTHYTHSVYAKNVGLIKLTSFYAYSPKAELGKLLVRYHIAP